MDMDETPWKFPKRSHHFNAYIFLSPNTGGNYLIPINYACIGYDFRMTSSRIYDIYLTWLNPSLSLMVNARKKQFMHSPTSRHAILARTTVCKSLYAELPDKAYYFREPHLHGHEYA